MALSSPAQKSLKTSKREVRLPDFMIVGAAKSATTTLYEYLFRHPDVYLTTPKEPEFFSRDSVYERGADWYAELYAGVRDGQVCGEASTTYTRYPLTPDVPGRIARYAPEVKFIYIMRHPIDRAFSHYKHTMRHGVTMTFEEGWASRDDIYRGWDGRAYTECSKYLMQIEQYLRHFPRESFLFLFYEDIIASPATVLEACQEFLGLEVRDVVGEGELHSNVGDEAQILRHRTTQQLQRVPGAAALVRALPQSVRQAAFRLVRKSPLGRRVTAENRIQPMLPETRQELLALFRQPNEDLAAFLGRDLSHWNA